MYEIGDTVRLLRAERGYFVAEVVDFDGVKLVLEVSSGYQFSVYEDEIKYRIY